MRLAVLTTHPVQYYVPLFRELARKVDLHVFYAHRATPGDQAAAGFDTAFEWDIDLTSGYAHSFLLNVARNPSPSRFFGCDTPEIGPLLAGGHFDVVLTLGWHVKSLLQGVWAAKRLNLPVMVRGDSQLGLQPNLTKRFIKRLLYPELLRIFDAALIVGNRNREFLSHYRYPEERMFASPHAVDTTFFANRSGPSARKAMRSEIEIDTETKVVLFAGKLVEFKCPLTVLDAVARLRTKGHNVIMLVAGAGQLEGALRFRALELAVPIRFLGFVNQSKMPEVYACADVLVLPSTRRETWGLVANEALASGCPVIISDAAGSSSDLCDEIAGFCFPFGDPDKLSQTTLKVLYQPPSKSSIKNLSNRHTLKNAAEGIVTAAEQVCAWRRYFK